jgi:photosynthetic reaction center cytochrome c subunit
MEQGSNDRQVAAYVSVGVGLAVAAITILTFWVIYWFALAPDVQAAQAEDAALYDPTDGILRITQATPAQINEIEQHIQEAGDPREVWLGNEAWEAGIQLGQEYINQYPQPQNVQVLTGMNTEQIWNYMQYQISGAMGVSCQYCHDINNYAADPYPEKISARLMIILLQDLNSQYMVNLPNWRGNYVRCATCHNGEPLGMASVSEEFVMSTPPIDVYLEPLDENGVPNRDATMSMSLKEATLYYLYNYQVWDPYTADDPMSGRGSLALTYEGGRTQDQVTINQNNMNLQGWALGVGCTYCHNSRNFYAYEADIESPQFHQTYAINRLKSQRMLLMTTFMADNWSRYVLPRSPYAPIDAPENLPLDEQIYYISVQQGSGETATSVDMAVPGCYTCHQGMAVPPAAINAMDIPEGEAGIYTFPPVLTGLSE